VHLDARHRHPGSIRKFDAKADGSTDRPTDGQAHRSTDRFAD
jgi:hypothetical protein